MKLNKNQRKFFTEAIKFFGDDSDNIRLKDLNAFASDNDLILPTSYLKNHCHQEGQSRGYYNLTLSGIKLKPKMVNDTLSEFNSSDSVILDSSEYAK